MSNHENPGSAWPLIGGNYGKLDSRMERLPGPLSSIVVASRGRCDEAQRNRNFNPGFGFPAKSVQSRPYDFLCARICTDPALEATSA